HRQREPHGPAGDQPAVRVHRGAASRRPAADGATLRRSHAPARRRRVRARHGMVDTAAADSQPLKSGHWTTLGDEALLDVRMCDLELSIDGTELEARIAQLNAELTARGLNFKPHYYLSDEWFTPDGIPGIAIPFYLAHPRLGTLAEREITRV